MCKEIFETGDSYVTSEIIYDFSEMYIIECLEFVEKVLLFWNGSALVWDSKFLKWFCLRGKLSFEENQEHLQLNYLKPQQE